MADPHDKIRQICLDLPETFEQEAWGDPTFRVRNKIFCMVKQGDGWLSAWVKAPQGMQSVLIDAVPERFFRPPYVGHKGWVGIRLDDAPDWAEVGVHVHRSYDLIAPEKLRGQKDDPDKRG